MTLSDFYRCTPLEFTAIVEQWTKQKETAYRNDWERIRMQCLCSLQPYSQKQLSPYEVMPLPWDENTEAKRNKKTLTPEERQARLKEAVKRYGLKV